MKRSDKAEARLAMIKRASARLGARQYARRLCKSLEHFSGVFDGSGVRMLMRPRQSGGGDEPNSRPGGAKVDKCPETEPSHRSHGLVEVLDRVLTLASWRGFDRDHDRRTEGMSIHENILDTHWNAVRTLGVDLELFVTATLTFARLLAMIGWHGQGWHPGPFFSGKSFSGP
jgi:hypothetical protein